MLPVASVILYFAVTASARPSDPGFWAIDIDNGPAPAPDKGPPGSAHAVRDPAQLKFEVIGIVAAYLVWLIITVIGLTTFGKRLRRQKLAPSGGVDMVQMKSLKSSSVQVRELDVASGPKSPNKMAGFMNWGRKNKTNESEVSVSSVATAQLENQRSKNMDELTKLYAAVMAHDEQRSQKGKSSGVPSPQSPHSPESFYPPISPEYPPEFAHLRHNQAQALSHPMAPTPVDSSFPQDTHEQSTSRNSGRTNKSTPLSYISDMSRKHKPSSLPLRGHNISQPIGSPDMIDAHIYSDTVPLSPRLYSPGPAPPTPGKKMPAISSVQEVGPRPQSKDRRAPPSALNFHPQSLDAAANASQTSLNGNKKLPFREVYGDASMRSAPPTKTTFLERRESSFKRDGLRTGVVPMTPYSPYMPSTPMTPITPRRLMTKQDLKSRKKEEKLKVLNEDDLVRDEDDKWGA